MIDYIHHSRKVSKARLNRLDKLVCTARITLLLQLEMAQFFIKSKKLKYCDSASHSSLLNFLYQLIKTSLDVPF